MIRNEIENSKLRIRYGLSVLSSMFKSDSTNREELFDDNIMHLKGIFGTSFEGILNKVILIESREDSWVTKMNEYYTKVAGLEYEVNRLQDKNKQLEHAIIAVPPF